FMNNFAYLYQTTLNGTTLKGEVQVSNGVIFQGITTVTDTLQNYYYSGYTLNVQGDIINNGLIRDYYNPMILNITGNMTNNGVWANSRTELNGESTQHVVINDSHALSGQLDLNAILTGDAYQWLLDDVEIADAISQSLTFYSVGEPEFGHYMCQVTSSGKETLSSRMIRISNGSPEFSTLPNVAFSEDHSLKLHISSLFDYVEDPNDADSVLVWTILDNDDVITEIIADTINFSSTLNWFGSDTLLVIVSDGQLSDTTNLIVIVEPVNDAPVITALPDTSMFEDDSLKLALTAFDVDSDSLIFMASCDTSAIELILAKNYLTLIPLVDWSGNAQIQVIVSDTELSDTTDFILIVNALNDPPAAFSLITPADSIVNSSDTVMVFQWENSIDTDNDLLSYGISLSGENFEYVTNCDTSFINLNILDIAVPRDVCIRWNVFVTDNIDTTWSNETWHFTIIGQLGIETVAELPFSYTLHQNYPNPFNPSTVIQYSIPKTSHVSLTIYNMTGQIVEKLINQTQEPGFYSVNWDARIVSTGMYFYRIQADGFSAVKKCLLIK
ncbi:T9SS type A sorting domain-containing protein, partial [bacterium]|nr:T9SS type A sorting domain-containing protein [bacterium]